MNGSLENTPLFLERQWLPTWALVLIVAAPLPVLASLLAVASREPGPARTEALWAAGVGIGVCALVLVLVGSMRTRVDTSGLLVTFGFPGWLRFRFRREEIEAAGARRYRPIREFGGWGIRGLGAKRALNMRGDEGVELTVRRKGRTGTVMIGSQRPRELEHALRLLEIPPPAGRALDPV